MEDKRGRKNFLDSEIVRLVQGVSISSHLLLGKNNAKITNIRGEVAGDR